MTGLDIYSMIVAGIGSLFWCCGSIISRLDVAGYEADIRIFGLST
jgi:hypothetical protein